MFWAQKPKTKSLIVSVGPLIAAIEAAVDKRVIDIHECSHSCSIMVGGVGYVLMEQIMANEQQVCAVVSVIICAINWRRVYFICVVFVFESAQHKT